ncbi:MAG: DUF2442 domain-containing protein [Gemmatimonadales bacterium]
MADRTLTDAEILAQVPEARDRERSARKSGHRAKAVRFDRAKERIVLELSNGMLFAFPTRSIAPLRRASPMELSKVVISASGSALRWEALDVDLSVAGLLLAAVEPNERVRHLATLAGRTTSHAKAVAARLNGAKGGRPRRSTTKVAARQQKD